MIRSQTSRTARATHGVRTGASVLAATLALAAVKEATARFRKIGSARERGYTNQYPAGCAASSAGAQGFHCLNAALVDDKVELLRPELVMYEPQADGTMQLVGDDYVVPFMRNEPLGVWALHIWVRGGNPSGIERWSRGARSSASADGGAEPPPHGDVEED